MSDADQNPNEMRHSGADRNPDSPRHSREGGNPDFPKEWIFSKLEELVSQSFTGLVRSASEQGIENSYSYLKMNNLNASGKFDVSNLVRVNADEAEVEKYALKKGDFIFNTRNSVELVGKCGVFLIDSSMPILFNNNLLKINFFHVEPKIIAHWLNSALGKDALKSITSATTSVAAIYQKQLMAIDVPVIPLAEQQQIAKKLDELLAQVDTLKARLDAIPKILKRFRQSVLAAAVSGRLIGKDSIKVNRLFDCVDILNGARKPFSAGERKSIQGEIPYYGATGIVDYLNDFTHEGRFLLVGEDGANLLSKSKDLAFIAAGKIWVNNHAHVLKEKLGYSLDYIKISINALDLTPWVTGSAQPKLTKRALEDLPIPSLEFHEQTEIVRRVEQLFAYAEQIERRVKDAQARVNHLTQSILAKAFRGELTADWRAQNPHLISGENSAAALLQKIKAEREATAKPKRKLKA